MARREDRQALWQAAHIAAALSLFALAAVVALTRPAKADDAPLWATCILAAADPAAAEPVFRQRGWRPTASDEERLATLTAITDLSRLYDKLGYMDQTESAVAQLLDLSAERAAKILTNENAMTYRRGSASALWSVTERPDHDLNLCAVAAPSLPRADVYFTAYAQGASDTATFVKDLPDDLADEILSAGPDRTAEVNAAFVRLNFDREPPRPVIGRIGLIATSRTPRAADIQR